MQELPQERIMRLCQSLQLDFVPKKEEKRRDEFTYQGHVSTKGGETVDFWTHDRYTHVFYIALFTEKTELFFPVPQTDSEVLYVLQRYVLPSYELPSFEEGAMSTWQNQWEADKLELSAKQAQKERYYLGSASVGDTEVLQDLGLTLKFTNWIVPYHFRNGGQDSFSFVQYRSKFSTSFINLECYELEEQGICMYFLEINYLAANEGPYINSLKATIWETEEAFQLKSTLPFDVFACLVESKLLLQGSEFLIEKILEKPYFDEAYTFLLPLLIVSQEKDFKENMERIVPRVDVASRNLIAQNAQLRQSTEVYQLCARYGSAV